MRNLDELREAFEAANAEAVQLSDEYHAERMQLKEDFGRRIAEANQRLANVQKELNNAEALATLIGENSDDEAGSRLAHTLGLVGSHEEYLEVKAGIE